MTIMHIVYTPFTGVGLKGGYRGDEWFKYRIELFKKYTLPSLMNQTNKNFAHWISFRPEELHNPICKEFVDYLGSLKNYGGVITYNGLMYHDDKFSKGILPKAYNFARIIRDCMREKRFVRVKEAVELFKDKNDTLPLRLYYALDNIRRVMPQTDYVYFTRIDSDDMLEPTAIEEIQKIKPAEKTALVMKKGYCLNTETGEKGIWNPTTNPPFHTILFPSSIFYDADKHMEYMKGFTSHEDIEKMFTTIQLPDNLYCVGIHPKYHISTNWDHPFRHGTTA